VFISYRRNDSGDATGRLHDHLGARFGQENIFIDIDSIPLGTDFREYIDGSVKQCDVLLAVIGEHWLEAKGRGVARTSKRRLDDPADSVRIEIESALKRGIPVVPVLVGTAAMPADEDLPEGLKKLAFLNAAEIRPGRDFRAQVERLIKFLGSLPEAASAVKVRPPGGSA